MASSPNVLFLLTDDQRFDTIAAIGNAAVHTPNLDQLVADGVAFTNAHIMGGSSGAVCMPSRGMIHTGRTLYHLDGKGQELSRDHVLMCEHFRNHGYQTFGTGKWHNGPAAYHRSFTDGGEIFFGGMSDHWNVPACDFDPTGEYPDTKPLVSRWGQRLVHTRTRYDHIPSGAHSTDLFSRFTMDWLSGPNRDRSKPFFAYVSFMAPHDPREMPAEFLNLYHPDEIELPPNFASEHPFDHGSARIRDEVLAGFPRTEDEVRKHIAEYYAMISHLDARIGQMIQLLKDQGEYENTIVVLAGDNGLAVGQHGLMGKQVLYQHSVQVPLLLTGPGVPKSERRDGLCYLLDVYPTLCDLAGLSTPASVEGRSLKPMLDDPTARTRDDLLLAMIAAQRGVRDERWKLIETCVNGERHTQLFDLADDPWEMHDLAEAPAHAEELNRLRSRMETGWSELDDDWDDQGGAFWSAYRAR